MKGGIEIQSVHFNYPDGITALQEVSCRIEDGESVALVGANGAGKTTLLLLLTGFLTSQSGEIRIEGTLLTRKTLQECRRAIGMVFQDPNDQLFMPTVYEDVAFGPRNAGLSLAQVQAAATTALARVGADHLRNRTPHRLSAGEKREVAIATALALDPNILIMDEPSSHLDPFSRRRLIELLRSLSHTKLIATHDLELAVEVCNRSIVLDAGTIVADGPTRELLNDEAFMKAHKLERPHILSHHHPHA